MTPCLYPPVVIADMVLQELVNQDKHDQSGKIWLFGIKFLVILECSSSVTFSLSSPLFLLPHLLTRTKFVLVIVIGVSSAFALQAILPSSYSMMDNCSCRLKLFKKDFCGYVLVGAPPSNGILEVRSARTITHRCQLRFDGSCTRCSRYSS